MLAKVVMLALPCTAFRAALPRTALPRATLLRAASTWRGTQTPAMSAELPRQNRFELEGSVVQINELQSFDSGFTKREFVVSVEDGPYANDIKFDTVRDKTARQQAAAAVPGLR